MQPRAGKLVDAMNVAKLAVPQLPKLLNLHTLSPFYNPASLHMLDVTPEPAILASGIKASQVVGHARIWRPVVSCLSARSPLLWLGGGGWLGLVPITPNFGNVRSKARHSEDPVARSHSV